jgi:hypothetical protein
VPLTNKKNKLLHSKKPKKRKRGRRKLLKPKEERRLNIDKRWPRSR